jgi:GTP-binding protein HflX
MFERPNSGGENAILVSITFSSDIDQPPLNEFAELATSTGVKLVASITATRIRPDPKSFIGSGKLAEIEAMIAENEVDVVLFNHTLSPAQERNLERILSCKVLDRTGVILDIFAQRARSFDGKLQVELAQLKHLSTRLIRGWTHLERQKGGIGLRGPGETQLETDRRLIGGRIKAINKRLSKVTQQRELSRKARNRAQLPLISVVGYTNAGKSTLFNSLTKASVLAADQLFATLDTTLRRMTLPNKSAIILADTVGFIQQLPHNLIAAFRATLDETREADLLLHIVDASDTERQLRIEQVNEVLTEIGAAEVTQIIVYNKIDKLDNCTARYERDANGKIHKVWLSAVTGAGIDFLTQALTERQDNITCQMRVPVNAGDIRARLYAEALVLDEKYADNGDSLIKVQISAELLNNINKRNIYGLESTGW